MTTNGGTETDEPGGGSLVCPHCLTHNDPAADFCRKCGCPVGAVTTIDPLKRVYAQGFWFVAPASGRIHPIVFWGTWLIFGPSALLAGSVLLHNLLAPHDAAEWYHGLASRPLGLIVVALYLLMIGALLCKMTRNYLRCRHEAEPDDEAEEMDERDGEQGGTPLDFPPRPT